MLYTQMCIYMIRDEKMQRLGEIMSLGIWKTEHIYHLTNKNNIKENYEIHQILWAPT